MQVGHSYGGYGVYGLITQADRFKAAVALAGISDLTSQYGQFGAALRYDERPERDFFSMTWPETGQGGQAHLSNPPWRDQLRYVLNSPLFHVEQVYTPILIIQGDMDYVPIERGEEFFPAMQRLNKRARFVRYWDEGHLIGSPANQVDLHQQIFAWFDEFLMKPEKTDSTKQFIP